MKTRQYPTGRMFRVLCTYNHFHKISVNAKGQFILHNHAHRDLRRYRAFCQLGGQPMGCFRFLERWRDAVKSGRRSLLPSSALPFFRECRQLAVDRARAHEWSRQIAIQEGQPYFQRPRVISELMNRLLVKELQLPAGQWVRIDESYVLALTPFTGNEMAIDWIEFSPNWFEEIYQRGIAVAQGGLLFHVIDLQQGKRLGFTLHPIHHAGGMPTLSINTIYL